MSLKALQFLLVISLGPFAGRGDLVILKATTTMDEGGERRKRTSLKKKSTGNNGRNGEMENLLADSSRFLARIRISLSEV